MQEIWKDIKKPIDYTGLYQISNFGRVKSLSKICYIYNYMAKRKIKIIRKCKILKGGLNGTMVKYKYVGFKKEKNYKRYSVARLVAFAFIGNPPTKKHEINHIDFNSLNNHVNNLEWTTSSENSLHSSKNMSLSKRGEKHPGSLFTDKEALKIKRLRKKGYRIKDIAILYNANQNTITNITTRLYPHLNHLI